MEDLLLIFLSYLKLQVYWELLQLKKKPKTFLYCESEGKADIVKLAHFER